MSAKYCLSVPVFHFWPKVMHPAARSLCDNWAYCYYSYFAANVVLFCIIRPNEYVYSENPYTF